MHDQTDGPRGGSQGAGGSLAGSALRWTTATLMFPIGLAKVLAVLWTPRHRQGRYGRGATPLDAGGLVARRSPSATSAGS